MSFKWDWTWAWSYTCLHCPSIHCRLHYQQPVCLCERASVFERLPPPAHVVDITTEGCASWAQNRLMMPVPQPRSITTLLLREALLLRTTFRYASVRLLSDSISKWSLCVIKKRKYNWYYFLQSMQSSISVQHVAGHDDTCYILNKYAIRK